MDSFLIDHTGVRHSPPIMYSCPQAIIHQLSVRQAAIATSIIVVHKNNLTYCCYSLYLAYGYKCFLCKAIIHKPVFVPLSNRQMMVEEMEKPAIFFIYF